MLPVPQSFYTICGKFTFCICQISHSFIPIYIVHPHRFYDWQTRFPFLYGRAFILSWSFLLSPAIGFIRCKGRQSRLIRRFEVDFLQILPFCERVIGRKNRRMKLYRQP